MILRIPNVWPSTSGSSLLPAVLCLLVACADHRPKAYHPDFSSAPENKHQLLLGTPSPAYYETTDLVVKYLNEHLDSQKVRNVACTSLEEFETKLQKRYFDFTVINGPQLLTAEQSGYRVFGRISDDYRSFIIVNKDSGIQDFRGLRNRTIGLTGKKVLAGSVMPLMFLHHHGIDVVTQLKKIYSPSYESVLLDVCLGKCAAGAVWSTAYYNFLKKRPDLASRIEIKWITPSLVSSGILIRYDLDKSVAKKLTDLVLGLQNDEQGRLALQRIGISQFVPADSNSYIPLREYLRKYDSLIH